MPTVMVNLIMASAFASIPIYTIGLVPNRRLFYGLNFEVGGVAVAIFSALADSCGVETTLSSCRRGICRSPRKQADRRSQYAPMPDLRDR
jgi:hypothetical protein